MSISIRYVHITGLFRVHSEYKHKDDGAIRTSFALVTFMVTFEGSLGPFRPSALVETRVEVAKRYAHTVCRCASGGIRRLKQMWRRERGERNHATHSVRRA